MSAATAPIKISLDVDRLVSETAHFTGMTKKDVVETAVREYVEANRERIAAGVVEAVKSLDGSLLSTVSLVSGLSPERIEELGGVD